MSTKNMTQQIEKELRNAVEFLPGRLFCCSLSAAPNQREHSNKHFFSIDNELIYWNFYLDFGPLNLGQLYRFCCMLNTKLADPKLKDKMIYYCSGTHGHKRTNAAYLISSWAVLYLNKSPDDAFRPFRGVNLPFVPWHDATPSVCTFQLTILDTLRGLQKARDLKYFDFTKFDIDEYEHYEQVENGDLNWLVNNKFVAFAGPHATRESHPSGYHTLTPEDYIPYYKRKGVTLVVRLNKKYYDSKKFTAAGIDHLDLYFVDGSNPPDQLLQRFIEACEATSGSIAVHCKAGLGRTGCVIGCYLMKHHKITAEECIGWFRIARPGSIIGPQQQWMKDVQMKMWRDGDLHRQRIAPGSSASILSLGALQNEGTERDSSRGSGSIMSTGPGKGMTNLVSGMSGMSILDSREAAINAASAFKESNNENTQGDLLRIRRQQMKDEAITSSSVSSTSSPRSVGLGRSSTPTKPSTFNQFLSSWK